MQVALTTGKDFQEPERWCEIPGFSRYRISTYGRIKSSRNWRGTNYSSGGWRLLTPVTANHGYLVTVLTNDQGEKCQFRIHQLVALAFIGPRPQGYSTHHINEQRHDNYYKNLEYIQCGDHSRIHNKIKISKDERNEIRNLYLNHEHSISKLALVCEHSEPFLRELLQDLINKYEQGAE